MEKLYQDITNAISQVFERNSKRVDYEFQGYSLSVYWTGSVLRVDIKGLAAGK